MAKNELHHPGVPLEEDQYNNVLNKSKPKDGVKLRAKKRYVEGLTSTETIIARTPTHVLSFDLPAHALKKDFLLSLNSAATREAQIARQHDKNHDSTLLSTASQCAQCHRWAQVLNNKHRCAPCQAIRDRAGRLESKRPGHPPLCYCRSGHTHIESADDCLGSFAKKLGYGLERADSVVTDSSCGNDSKDGNVEQKGQTWEIKASWRNDKRS